MRPAACLALVIATGCSPLLGIQDPSSRGDAGGSDTGSDGSDGGPHLDGRLELSLGDFKLARDQVVNVHVRLIHPDNSAEDVTDRARLDSSNTAYVTVGTGHIDGVAAGTALVTATLGDATIASLRATVTAFVCHPVINEFSTGSSASADDEFVEIYNPCNHMVSVEGWTLDYRGPNAGAAQLDAHQMILLAGMMMPGELRLYAGSAYLGTSIAQWATNTGPGQNNGALGLRAGLADVGVIVDSVAYGLVAADNPFLEGNAAAQVPNGKSAARLPFDGKDDAATAASDGDNALDFLVVTTPTPNKRNAP